MDIVLNILSFAGLVIVLSVLTSAGLIGFLQWQERRNEKRRQENERKWLPYKWVKHGMY